MTASEPIHAPLRVSRRAIVRTVARLAYAGPLVVASFELASLGARAAEGEEIVSGVAQASPPAITGVTSEDPGTLDITGRYLAGASVRLVIDDGTEQGKTVTQSSLGGTIGV